MRSRQMIIAATLRLIEEGGFSAVNVAAVAEEAAVSRQTVYSIFGSREELVSQTLSDVALDWSEEIRTRLASCREADEFIIELIVAGRAQCRAHPALASLLVAGPGNPLFDAGMMRNAVPVVTVLLAGLPDRDSRFTPVFDDVAEMVTRLAVSVVLFNSERIATDDDLREFLRRWLLPALSSIAGRPGPS